MGNSSSHHHEIIIDYDDDLQEGVEEEQELVEPAQEAEIQIDEIPPNVEPEIPAASINHSHEEEEGIVVHISPAVRSLVSIIPESLVAIPEQGSELQQPHKSKGISLEKTEDSVPIEECAIAKESQNFIRFPQAFHLHFCVDTETDCTINIIWSAKEDRKSKRSYTSRFAKGEFSCHVSAGLNQSVHIASSDIPSFSAGDARFLTDGAQFQPLLIQIVSNEVPLLKDNVEISKEQLIYAAFEKHDEDNTWSLSVNKIAVVYKEHEYIVYDLFGTESDEPEGNECVICMTDEPVSTLLVISFAFS